MWSTITESPKISKDVQLLSGIVKLVGRAKIPVIQCIICVKHFQLFVMPRFLKVYTKLNMYKAFWQIVDGHESML